MPSPMEGRENPYRPWSQLPTELLHVISQKLADDISGFIRFRCVCGSWRRAAKPSDLHPQLPWLLLPYDAESSSRSFYSFADQSTRTLLLPETRNQRICGSSNGWLVMLDEALQFSLFNPITRSLLRLPPITSFPGYNFWLRFKETFAGDVRVVDWYGDEVTLEGMNGWFDCFAHVSSDPESVNAVDGVVAFMVVDASMIQYCKLGDAAWTVIDSGLGLGIKAMAFHKGNFYFVDYSGRTAVCELGPAKKDAALIPPVNLTHPSCSQHPGHYLVTFRDDLLLVTRHKSNIDCTFDYHKLEAGSGGTMTWSRVGGVGDCAVFVADGRLHSMGRLMTVASRAPGYRKGCVFYVVPPKCHRHIGLSRMQVIMVDGGDTDFYHVPWTECEPKPMSPSWIVPSLC